MIEKVCPGKTDPSIYQVLRDRILTESGALKNAQYSFGTRFEKAAGTNPEELLAAAHAGCFSMALSLMLSQAGVTPERIDTTAAVTIEPDGEGFRITGRALGGARAHTGRRSGSVQDGSR